MRAVAAARPDGYTLSYTSAQTIVVNPWVQKGMIDTLTTLASICQTTDYQYVLVVNPKVPANTAAELVALAKRDPEKLTYSSAGVGSGNHLSGALFAEAAGIAVTHVPYKGTGPALADVLSGIITMNFSSLPPAVPQVRWQPQGARRDRQPPAVVASRRADTQGAGHRRGDQRLARPVRAGQHARCPPRYHRREGQAGHDGAKWAEVLDKDGVELPPERTRAEFARYIADEHAFWGKKLKALKIDME